MKKVLLSIPPRSSGGARGGQALLLLSLLALLLTTVATYAQVRLITTVEYQIDNGAFAQFDVADASSINWAEVIPTTGLSNGLHRLRVRGTDDQGRIAQVSDGFFGIISNDFSGQSRTVTNLEYRIDAGAFSPVDIPDGATYNWAQVIPTIGLSQGLHRLQVRGIDNAGRTGEVVVGFFGVINNDFTGQTRLATLSEYRIDGGAYTQIDHADAPIVNLNQVIATNALAIGLHSLEIRGTDDISRTGQVCRGLFVVTSPIVQGESRHIIAAECWFGTDPGVGNGIDIPLPQDGVFDEENESVVNIFTGVEPGYYQFGFRGQDNTGRWSSNVIDSVLVGPILVVSASGNDVVLNWDFPDGIIDQYYVYRAANTAGPFSVIDSTTARTYTDTGIFSVQDKGFYYVTFRDDSISLQQPNGTPVGR